MDLRLSPLAPHQGLAADLRLVEPCSGRVLDRRAAALESGPAAAARFAGEAAAELLRGRDLSGIRWSGKAGMTVLPEAPPARPPPAAPAPEPVAVPPLRAPVPPQPR